MSEHAATEHVAHAPAHYVKVWGILLVLLIVSVAGPFLGIKAVTLITAFGIALVKAWLVATRFMHVYVEPRWLTYLMVTMLAFMGLFFAGVSPDVMKHEGQNWTNDAAKAETARALAAHAEGEHAEGGHH